ncbi:MAG: glycosyltransferase family 39 protein, partial [Actinomycetota bacterium]|nr:glycosyltransferase family 39 protein [Actinomycetota bacterium]
MRAVSRLIRTSAKASGRRASSLAVLGIGACFVLWAAFFIYRSSVIAFDGNRYFALFDDAMISMRYGWNLAHGLGLVWNAGEYVEGYTNPLTTLAMALASTLFDKSGAVLAIQVFGVLLMLANAYLLMLIAEHLFSDETRRYRGLLRVLAFLSGLSYYPLLFWSLLGMETGLLTVLVSLSVLFALRYVRDRRPAQGALLSVSLGLAFLTRPDAVVFALPVFAYAFYGSRKAFAPSHLLALFGPLALFVAGHEAFRWVYYGELLPNTYTLKVSGMPLVERIKNGASFVVPFLEEVWVLLALVGGALLLDRRRGTLFLVGVFAVTLLYQIWTGGDAWDLWRIFSPAMPLMLMLAAWVVLNTVTTIFETAAFKSYSGRNTALRSLPGLVSVLAVLAVLSVVNLRYMPEITMQRQSLEEELNEKRMSVALALEEFTTPDATVGLFGVGTIPYYTGRPGIDFLGKMDPRIAHL